MENVVYCFQKYNKNLFPVGLKLTFLTGSSILYQDFQCSVSPRMEKLSITAWLILI